MKPKMVVGFMCGVDWQHELGEACGGNVVYPSIANLRHHRECAHECGVVKVSVELIEWVVPQNFEKYREPQHLEPK